MCTQYTLSYYVNYNSFINSTSDALSISQQTTQVSVNQ